MNNEIENGLEKSISYIEYRNLVLDLLAQGKSTGENQTETFLNYTKLNNSRMKRLDKTFTLSEKTVEKLQNLRQKHVWLVLTESWCGDASQSLPVMNKIAEESEYIELRILLRDENEELIDQFLTDGNRAIPKLIALDAETKDVVGTWGPRPTEAAKLVREYKEKFGKLDAEFKKDLQVWYNLDKGSNIEKEILEMLCVTADCV